MWWTRSNDNSAGTQNQVYAAGSNDVYTQDNPDGTTGETDGIPINGDTTNHRQEASYSQDVTVIAASVASCPLVDRLDNVVDLDFEGRAGTLISGTDNQVGAVYRFSNVLSGIDAVVIIEELSATSTNVQLMKDGLKGILQDTEGFFQLKVDLVNGGTNIPITPIDLVVTSFDIDGNGNNTLSDFVEYINPNGYFLNSPTQLQETLTTNSVNFVNTDTGVNNTTDSSEYAAGAVYENTNSIVLKGGVTNGSSPASRGVFFKLSAASLSGFTALDCNSFTPQIDYGDAPDTGAGTGTGNYRTLSSDGGARHEVKPSLSLGSGVTVDTNGFGNGTDSNGNATDDNDDAFTSLSSVPISGTYDLSNIPVSNTTGKNATLHGWIDFAQDGEFEPSEYQSTTIPSGTATANLSWSVPGGTTAGTTYARFRLTTNTLIDDGTTADVDERSFAPASDGEVEDYQVAIESLGDNRPLGSPFTCDSTFYITIGPGGGKDQQLYDVDRSGSTFTFNPIGAATNTAGGYPVNFDYNALAFNPIDNYIYAYINRSDATSGPYSPGNVVKIGNDGIVHSLGVPTGGTITGSFFAASILSDGTYVIGAGGKFATLDVTTTPPTITNSQATVSGVAFNDFAVDPRNPVSVSGKEVYGVNENGSQDRLVILDMTTFPPTIKSQAPNPTGFNHNAGSQFVDAFGTLYYRSNSTNTLYKVNTDSNSPDYGKATAITTAPSGGNHDGVSCLFATAMEKEVRNVDGNAITEPVPAGETVQYVYKIATGNSLDVNGVTFTDDLRSVTGGNPVNGTFLSDSGKVTVSKGSGNITFDNNNQTLQITNLTLPGQNSATPEAEALTITAEVTVPKTTTPGTYLNQSFLTNLPAIYPPSIPSDYPPSAPYEDPTPLEVTEPIANNPNVLLVKRITQINDATTTKDGDDLSIYNQDNSNPYDDNKIEISELPENQGDPKPDTDKWVDTTSDTSSTFLIGGINGGKVEPNDELEYTIYFLSAGDSEANSVLVCDRVPENVSFIPTSFNNQTQATGGVQGSNRGIVWLKDGNTESLTNTKDGDAAQYFPPGIEPSTIYPQIQCSGANTNGAVVVNLGNLPNATAPGTPNTSYGYIRFKGKVK